VLDKDPAKRMRVAEVVEKMSSVKWMLVEGAALTLRNSALTAEVSALGSQNSTLTREDTALVSEVSDLRSENARAKSVLAAFRGNASTNGVRSEQIDGPGAEPGSAALFWVTQLRGRRGRARSG
jgi:hypothetical protein